MALVCRNQPPPGVSCAVGGAAEGMDGSDLSDLGLLVIQIDGIHMDDDMTLVAAIGVDLNGDKHPLGCPTAHGKRADRAGGDR